MSSANDILRPFSVLSLELKFSDYSSHLNTNASHVEDIDNPHTFAEWSNIFRTRSFTLCKNDLDFNEKSETETVSRVHIIVINSESVRVLCATNQVVGH